jgi:hypothetical protein
VVIITKKLKLILLLIHERIAIYDMTILLLVQRANSADHSRKCLLWSGGIGYSEWVGTAQSDKANEVESQPDSGEGSR